MCDDRGPKGGDAASSPRPMERDDADAIRRNAQKNAKKRGRSRAGHATQVAGRRSDSHVPRSLVLPPRRPGKVLGFDLIASKPLSF